MNSLDCSFFQSSHVKCLLSDKRVLGNGDTMVKGKGREGKGSARKGKRESEKERERREEGSKEGRKRGRERSRKVRV